MPLPNARRTALLVLGTLLLLRLSPMMSVYNASLLLVGNSCGWAWQTVRAVPAPKAPLKVAILNVTSDFDQLTHLIGDFMQTQDPAVEQRFKQFLAERATRSYPRLESLLDWLLAVYKFIFPFLLISMAAKRGGSREPPVDAALDEDAAQLGFDPNAPLMPALGRRGSQQHDTYLLANARGGRAGSGTVETSHAQLQRGQQAGTTGSGSFGGALQSGLGNGSIARAGSQSPNGPETPVEGAASRMPQQPAIRRTAVAKSPRHQPTLTTSSEAEHLIS